MSAEQVQRMDPVEIPLEWAPPPLRLTGRIRVLLVDGDPIARAALRDALRTEGPFVIVAEAADGVDAVELATHYRPDVVVLDVELGRIGAHAAMLEITRLAPEVHLLALERSAAIEPALASLRAGACGAVVKDAPVALIAGAIRAAARDEATVSAPTAAELLVRLRRLPRLGSGVRPVRSRLTSREWEVFDLLGAGTPTAEAACLLGLSPATIESHRKSVLRKLGARNTAEAIVAADDLWTTGAAV